MAMITPKKFNPLKDIAPKAPVKLKNKLSPFSIATWELNNNTLASNLLWIAKEDAIQRKTIQDKKILNFMNTYKMDRKYIFDLWANTRQQLLSQWEDISWLDDIDLAEFALDTAPEEERKWYLREWIIGSIWGAWIEARERAKQASERTRSWQQSQLEWISQSISTWPWALVDIINDVTTKSITTAWKAGKYLWQKVGNELRPLLWKDKLTKEEIIQASINAENKVKWIWTNVLDKLSPVVWGIVEWYDNLDPATKANLESLLPYAELWIWWKIVSKVWEKVPTKWISNILTNVWNKGKRNMVLNMIKEADTLWNKRAALKRWWLDTQGSLSKFLIWSKDLVKPSKRTLDAADEVVRVIKSPSKDPQKLFTQVSTEISKIWSNLEWKLKTIGIKWTDLSISNLNTKLADLSTEIKDISPTMWKRLQVLSKNITNSETADDFWKALQQLDDMIPDSIKSWVDLSGKDQYIYDAWRAARSEGNDVLAKIAEAIPDTEVKRAFKSMTNLYHATWQIDRNIWRLTPKVKWVWSKLLSAWKWIAWTVVAGKVLQELWVFN